MKKIIVLLVLLLTLCSCSSKETTTEEDITVEKARETIAKDYPEIDGECVIYKAEKDQILNMLKHGTGVIFFSWIDCPWCHRYVNNVNSVCRDAGLEVFYFDIYDDRQNNTDFYLEVKKLVNDALEEENSFDSNGETRIYVPNIYFVSEGKIIGHDNTSSMESTKFEDTAESYWAEVIETGNTREQDLVAKLQEYASKTKELKDEIDKKGCAEDTACKL